MEVEIVYTVKFRLYKQEDMEGALATASDELMSLTGIAGFTANEAKAKED